MFVVQQDYLSLNRDLCWDYRMVCCATRISVVELQNVCLTTAISVAQTTKCPIPLHDHPGVFYVVFFDWDFYTLQCEQLVFQIWRTLRWERATYSSPIFADKAKSNAVASETAEYEWKSLGEYFILQ